MLVYKSVTNNPFFNIATEEYLFKNYNENFLLLYRNKSSIILGKHQNAFAEINYPETLINNIPVIRRLSGGGTVYHDEGNINFSFIMNQEKGQLVNFKKHIQPFFNFLTELGINVSYSNRNDLFIGDRKISGNAEHVFKNRVLHHGTLLFDSDLKALRKYLKSSEENFDSKAIKSKRSPVDNIANHLKNKLSIEDFIELLFLKIEKEFPGFKYFELSQEDFEKIDQLINKKYQSWEWNFGYSPEFCITKTGIILNKRQTVKTYIKKGIIQKIENNIEQSNDIPSLNDLLQGKKYEYYTILNTLENADLSREFMQLLF